MTAGWLAAAAAAVASLLLRAPAPRGRLRAAVAPDVGPASPPGSAPARALAVMVGAGTALVARLGWGPAGRRSAAARRAAALDAAAAFVAELRAGSAPRPALLRAAASARPPVCPAAAGAARLDGDVAEALRQDARDRQLPLLRSLAACWEVGEASGAGLADAVDRLVATARAAEEVRVELEAQLAAPRATARLLATLPIMGIAMGVMLGADPLGWLLGSAVGRGCLAAGLALTALGLAWTGRIAARVERLL